MCPSNHDLLTEDILPYACSPAHCRWMLEGNFRNTCETEGLSIRGPDDPDKEWGRVYEPDRQVALRSYFCNKLKYSEGEALIFYCISRGNPVDEQAARLVVGDHIPDHRLTLWMSNN